MDRPKLDDDTLQMLFDGELPPEEEAAVRELVESSPEHLKTLGQWNELGDAMRATSDTWGDTIDSDALFSRIEAELEGSKSVSPPAPGVVPIRRAVPGRRERRIWGGVATGFAAAAAILLAVFAWPTDRVPEQITSMIRGSTVVEVDFGDNAGTIFEVEGSAGQPLTVVWISDEKVAVP